jgi:hypothetical protein
MANPFYVKAIDFQMGKNSAFLNNVDYRGENSIRYILNHHTSTLDSYRDLPTEAQQDSFVRFLWGFKGYLVVCLEVDVRSQQSRRFTEER